MRFGMRGCFLERRFNTSGATFQINTIVITTYKRRFLNSLDREKERRFFMPENRKEAMSYVLHFRQRQGL